MGVGEEGEDFVDGAREEDGAADGEDFHESWMSEGARRGSLRSGRHTF